MIVSPKKKKKALKETGVPSEINLTLHPIARMLFKGINHKSFL